MPCRLGGVEGQGLAWPLLELASSNLRPRQGVWPSLSPDVCCSAGGPRFLAPGPADVDGRPSWHEPLAVY